MASGGTSPQPGSLRRAERDGVDPPRVRDQTPPSSGTEVEEDCDIPAMPSEIATALPAPYDPARSVDETRTMRGWIAVGVGAIVIAFSLIVAGPRDAAEAPVLALEQGYNELIVPPVKP